MKIYENILKGKVKYPPYIQPPAQDLLQQLITADLTKRLGNLHGGAEDVKRHAWFAEVTWDRLAKKDIDAPYVPPVKAGVGDASQFDKYPEETEQYGLGGPDEYVFISSPQRQFTNWCSGMVICFKTSKLLKPTNTLRGINLSDLKNTFYSGDIDSTRYSSTLFCTVPTFIFRVQSHCFVRLAGGFTLA